MWLSRYGTVALHQIISLLAKKLRNSWGAAQNPSVASCHGCLKARTGSRTPGKVIQKYQKLLQKTKDCHKCVRGAENSKIQYPLPQTILQHGTSCISRHTRSNLFVESNSPNISVSQKKVWKSPSADTMQERCVELDSKFILWVPIQHAHCAFPSPPRTLCPNLPRKRTKQLKVTPRLYHRSFPHTLVVFAEMAKAYDKSQLK